MHAVRVTILSTLCGLLCGAQEVAPEVSIHTSVYTPPSAALRVESNLVETGLTVRDRDGRTVGGLHASDIEVLDNGATQQITAFSEIRSDNQPARSDPRLPSVQTDPHEPKFITFFFDDFHNGFFNIPYVKEAARGFITKGLKAWDMISIATASGEGELPFTNDTKLFAEKFAALRSHNRGLAVPITIPEAEQQNFTMVASLNAAAKGLSEQRGKRIMLVVSWGFNPLGARQRFEDFIEAALHSNITVQAIHARLLDITPATLGPAVVAYDNARWMQSLLLQAMAERTGGHLFKDSNDYTVALTSTINPEVTYMLAFQPKNLDGKFHTLKIRLKSKAGESLDFRPGYWSRQDTDSDKNRAALAPLDDAVFSNRTLADVPATVRLSAAQPKGELMTVSVEITVNMNGLQFVSSQGRHKQQLVFLMTLLDGKGAFVTGEEAIMDLALTDERLASLKKDGMKVIGTLAAPPGVYRVRSVVREELKGELAASTTAVELLRSK